jgi:hypothetical protein
MHYCDDCADKACIARGTKGISHCHQKRFKPFVAESKASKYKNNITYVNGIKFHSKKEAERYLVLKDMKRNGEITNLELQPEYILQEGFRYNGKKILPIKYIADFRYKRQGETIVEDTKGHRTKEYLLKRKMMLKQHGIEIYET